MLLSMLLSIFSSNSHCRHFCRWFLRHSWSHLCLVYLHQVNLSKPLNTITYFSLLIFLIQFLLLCGQVRAFLCLCCGWVDTIKELCLLWSRHLMVVLVSFIMEWVDFKQKLVCCYGWGSFSVHWRWDLFRCYSGVIIIRGLTAGDWGSFNGDRGILLK